MKERRDLERDEKSAERAEESVEKSAEIVSWEMEMRIAILLKS